MCQNAADHCWSAWTSWPSELDTGVVVWYLKRYCYWCKMKEWV